MSEENTKNWLSITVKVLQIIFFITIGICTIYNLNLYTKQNKLIFKPVIGVTDVKTTRLRAPGTEDTYENIKYVKMQFTIENVGNLPAKDFKIKTIGKLGKIILPHTESEEAEGIMLVQNAKVTNTVKVNKSIMLAKIQKCTV